MDRPPMLPPRPPAVVAFGWIWSAAVLADLGWTLFGLSQAGRFTGADGAQLFLTALFLFGGWMVARYAVAPIESGMALGLIFALANDGLRVFNAVQDDRVNAAAVVPLAIVAVEGLALLLLRTRLARAWIDESWPIIQAHYAKNPEGS